VCEIGIEALSECRLARVTEGSVTEVVSKRCRFRQVLVETERSRDYARDLRDLKRMRQARSVMIARRSQKHLRFVHKSAEGLRMDYLIAVALELGAVCTGLVRIISSARIRRQKRVRRKRVLLTLKKNIGDIFILARDHTLMSSFQPVSANFSTKRSQNRLAVIIYAFFIKITLFL
jgi:hypothetical protein